MSKILRFWVDVECDERDGTLADESQVASILRQFEACGDAMRSLNRRGQVVWKASPSFLQRLADAEAEVDDDRENER